MKCGCQTKICPNPPAPGGRKPPPAVFIQKSEPLPDGAIDTKLATLFSLFSILFHFTGTVLSVVGHTVRNTTHQVKCSLQRNTVAMQQQRANQLPLHKHKKQNDPNRERKTKQNKTKSTEHQVLKTYTVDNAAVASLHFFSKFVISPLQRAATTCYTFLANNLTPSHAKKRKSAKKRNPLLFS